MIAPEVLLKMDSVESIKAMVVDIFNAGFERNWVEVYNIAPVVGDISTKTIATTFFNGAYSPISAVAIEPFQFYYHRMDMTSFFEGVDKNVTYRSGAKAVEIFRDLTHEFKIPVRDLDVVGSTYPTFGTIVINAGVKSPRWVGSLILQASEYAPDIESFVDVRKYTFPFNSYFSSQGLSERLSTYINMTHSDRLPILLTPVMLSPDEHSVESIAPNESPNNTKILVRFIRGYSGELEIVYTRRSFPDSYRWPVKLSGSGDITSNSFLTQLSEVLGVIITSDDVEVSTPPSMTVGSKKVFHVPFKTKSLAFVGEVWVEYERLS